MTFRKNVYRVEGPIAVCNFHKKVSRDCMLYETEASKEVMYEETSMVLE